MSNRKEITKQLTELLKVHINPNGDTRIYTAAEVTFNYLVLPEGLYEELKRSIPYDVGVYEPSGDIWKPLKCVKKARQVTRKRSVAEMLLMMFRSSNRELIKKEK